MLGCHYVLGFSTLGLGLGLGFRGFRDQRLGLGDAFGYVRKHACISTYMHAYMRTYTYISFIRAHATRYPHRKVHLLTCVHGIVL